MNVKIKVCVKVWGVITEFKSNLNAFVSKMYPNVNSSVNLFSQDIYNKFRTSILSRSRVEKESVVNPTNIISY